ncbi:MAG: hypothetical protein LBJ69_00600 [Holosporales bacterium]|jgi:archaellum component FlaC|nr:hypothetical protein [Holosporales bacterium]
MVHVVVWLFLATAGLTADASVQSDADNLDNIYARIAEVEADINNLDGDADQSKPDLRGRYSKVREIIAQIQKSVEAMTATQISDERKTEIKGRVEDLLRRFNDMMIILTSGGAGGEAGADVTAIAGTQGTIDGKDTNPCVSSWWWLPKDDEALVSARQPGYYVGEISSSRTGTQFRRASFEEGHS